LAIIAVLGLVFVWIVRALPHIALAQIGDLTNTRIAVDSMSLGLDGSVLIKNLVIRPDREQKYDDAILKAKTVYARFSIGSVLLLGPQLKEIRVNDFVFDAQYDLDAGRWNVAALKVRVPRNGSGKMPAVHLSQGTLQYSKVSNGQAKVAASVPVRAEFGFDQWTQEGYRFNIGTAALSTGFGKSSLSGFFKPARPELAERGRITVTGGISSTDIPALEWAWAVDVLAAELDYDQDRNYSVKLRIKDFHSTHTPSPDAFGLVQTSSLAKSTAFGALQGFFSRYSPVGTVDIDVAASGNFDRLSESTTTGKIYCKGVSVCDRHFPYAIEHLAGQVDFTQDGVVLNALSGKHGDVDITVDGLVKGFGPAQQYQLRVTSNNMVLDSDLYGALSAEQKKRWDAFSPGGRVAVDQRFTRKSEADARVTLTVELLDAQAAYKSFPYPLRNLTGKLFFDGDSVLVSDVVSQAEGCKITFNGNVTGHNADQPICYLSVKADNVPLDSTLAAALPAGQRSFYDRLGMAGLADAQAKIFTLQQGPESQQNCGPSFLADVTLKEASLSVLRSSAAAPPPQLLAKQERGQLVAKPQAAKDEKVGESPLEIRDISAKAVITPDSISIKEFSGQCSDGRVSIAGGISLTDQAQPSRYHLTVDAQQTQLTAELIGLLPAPAKKIFSGLTPQGRINLAADLRKAAADEAPSYQIVVQCLGDSAAFAYPLKNIVGRLTITNKTVTFEDITAAPAAGQSQTCGEPSRTIADGKLVVSQIEPSQIVLNGRLGFADDALGQASLALSARDIAFDEQLGTALTNTGIAPFYGKLAPAGRFDLDLENIKIFSSQTNEKHAEFAGSIRLKDCNFDLSGVRAELDAQLHAKGSYKIGAGFSAGAVSLSADSLRLKGKTINNLKADINYDPDTQSWLAENLLADCYGGKVIGKLEFKRLSQQSLKYMLQVGFNRVDLKQFLADTGLAPALASQEAAGAAQRAVPGEALPTSFDFAQDRGGRANDRTSGTMGGALSIVAELGAGVSSVEDGNGGRIGQCRLIIRDMEVGKLSPLAKLLYVLKLTEPKDFAFEQMVVDSYIKGDKLLFEKFDLSGQAIAFSGSGWMDLAGDNVDLVLTARGKRLAAAEPSVVQSLAEGLGQAVVRVEVTGNVHDPQVITRTLPVIEDSLKILGTKRK
jgi:hypothetical protein